ncbi:MAG: GNAT family protein [Bacteroidetes bacterium]|nr:GNAT family protein [Bacteroidota bacterium]
MQTFKIITDRLVIRCYKEADAWLLKKSIDESLEHLKPWMPWAKDEPQTLAQKVIRVQKFQKQFEEGEDYVLGVFNKEESELIGSTGFHTRVESTAREIGYWVNVNHTKQGIATEIVFALTKVGFEVETLERLAIRCHKNNLASMNVAKRVGFVLKETAEGNVQDNQSEHGEMTIWEMTREKYFLNPSSLSLQAFDAAGNLLK